MVTTTHITAGQRPFFCEPAGTLAALRPGLSLLARTVSSTRAGASRPTLGGVGVPDAQGGSAGVAADDAGSRSVRSALEAALTEARGAGRMRPDHELRALLAVRVAELLDAEAVSEAPNVGATLRLMDRLSDLVDALPLVGGSGPVAPAGGGDLSDGSGGGGVTSLFSRTPSVGDAADA